MKKKTIRICINHFLAQKGTSGEPSLHYKNEKDEKKKPY